MPDDSYTSLTYRAPRIVSSVHSGNVVHRPFYRRLAGPSSSPSSPPRPGPDEIQWRAVDTPLTNSPPARRASASVWSSVVTPAAPTTDMTDD